MKLPEMQRWTKAAWDVSSKKPDKHMELIYLMEEIGEMAEAIRKQSGKKKNKAAVVDLEKEMGDTLLALISLANRYHIDLEQAFEKTKHSIEKRYLRKKVQL